MSTVKEKVEAVVRELKTQRNEINTKLDLSKGEAKNQWEESETKWQKIEEKYSRLEHSFGKSTINLGKELEQLTSELKASYNNL